MDLERWRTRRGWLGAIAAAAGRIAGCAAPQAEDDGSTEDETSSSTGGTRAPGTRGSATPPSQESASAWPTFRRDNANTGSATDARGPVENPVEAWSVSTGGGVWSSPVVANGRLYVGCMDRKLYAIDAATGDVDWTYETGGPIESTPAVADGRVYFASFDKHVYCLDAETGEKQWSYETPGVIHSSPTVTETHLYIGCGTIRVQEVRAFLESSGITQEGSGLYALDRETGTLAWRKFTDHLVSSTPAVVDSAVYIGLIENEDTRPLVASLDVSDGSERWVYETESGVMASPSVHSNTVYCAEYDGIVYALSAETGKRSWSFDVGPGEIRGSTAVTEDAIYVPVSGNERARSSFNPVLFSLSPDGEERWEHEIEGARQMGSSPGVTADAVYVGTHHEEDVGGMFAVSHAGERLWSRQLAEGEGVGSSPTVVDGTLYYGADNDTVYAVS